MIKNSCNFTTLSISLAFSLTISNLIQTSRRNILFGFFVYFFKIFTRTASSFLSITFFLLNQIKRMIHQIIQNIPLVKNEKNHSYLITHSVDILYETPVLFSASPGSTKSIPLTYKEAMLKILRFTVTLLQKHISFTRYVFVFSFNLGGGMSNKS